MANLIRIPEPCHEDWDNMLPEANGRHCLQCCKTVVDFTGWETDAIADYLKNNKGGTCGRFTADQVGEPLQQEPAELAHYVLHAPMPFYRKLAAMIILFFGLSATAVQAQHAAGKYVRTEQRVREVKGDTIIQEKPVQVMGMVAMKRDTSKLHPVMGKPAPCHNPKEKPGRKTAGVKKEVLQPEPRYLKGDVQMVEPPVPSQVQPNK